MAEMKAGYKQTDIGVIPEDWDVMSVFDFGSFKSGNGFPLSYQGHQNGDLPFFKVSDMNNVGNGTYMKNANNYVSDEVSRTLKLNIIPEKSIVFAKIGAAIFLERKKLTVRRSCIDNNMMAYLLNHEIGEIEYFRYLFLNTEFGKLVSATALPSLSPKDIGELRYGFPKKKEQQRIAAALSDVDGLIESLEKLIIKKRGIKTAAMQQLLTGKKRLPGFDGEWEEKVVGDFGEVITGSTPSTKVSDFWHGDIPWITPTDINKKKDISASEREISQLGLSVSRKLPAGSVLVTCIASIGKNAILRNEGACNQQINAIVPNSKYSSDFIYYLMEISKDYLIANAGITATRMISKKDFSDISFLVPKLEEQAAIATILSDMDSEIDVLEQRLAKARSLKTGMMQELLTGKTRFIQTAQQPIKAKPKHNPHFEDAVIIAVLADKFGSETYPLGRKRYTKLSYFLHRYKEQDIDAYLKKAAGPYNPNTKYGGAEKIALTKQYVSKHKNKKFEGFVKGENINKAHEYFNKWFGDDASSWIEQFRYSKNDELELLATVDMAIQDLLKSGKLVSVKTVKAVLQKDKEWKPKLSREIFSDQNIVQAIQESQKLFGNKA